MPKSREGERPDARVLRSRAAMRQALLTLLEAVPLEEITGALIAERAKVGYATFFRHYADVRALLVDTVATLSDELATRMIPAMMAADTGGASLVLVREVAARRAVILALLVGAGDALRGILTRHLLERSAAWPDLAPPWLPRRLATRFAVAGTMEVLEWWLREEPGLDVEDVAAVLDRLVMAAVSGPPRAADR